MSKDYLAEGPILPIQETEQFSVEIIKQLEVSQIPAGKITRYWLHIIEDGMGFPIYMPIMVAKGVQKGPVLGITAAVHGDELNGIPVIQKFFKEIDVTTLRGTVVGVPVTNIPGYALKQRYFIDGIDLNRIMPGDPDGNVSQIYAYRWVNRVLNQFDYLMDLHTASFGRINSYYIRANMDDELIAGMALLQNAQIILNSHAPDTTIRGVINEKGGKAITLEVGDPNKFQKGMIRSSLTGIHNSLIYLGMTSGQIEYPTAPPIICDSSYWIYTDEGGVLQVLPDIAQILEKGDTIAILKNIFGDTIRRYLAPERGIVIGKSNHPVAQTGSRILHLGIMK